MPCCDAPIPWNKFGPGVRYSGGCLKTGWQVRQDFSRPPTLGPLGYLAPRDGYGNCLFCLTNWIGAERELFRQQIKYRVPVQSAWAWKQVCVTLPRFLRNRD